MHRLQQGRRQSAQKGKNLAAGLLEQLRPYFQNMVDGMGDLILISSNADVVRYKMLHDEGGGVIAAFPVYFIKDGNGNWKIYCF